MRYFKARQLENRRSSVISILQIELENALWNSFDTHDQKKWHEVSNFVCSRNYQQAQHVDKI